MTLLQKHMDNIKDAPVYTGAVRGAVVSEYQRCCGVLCERCRLGYSVIEAVPGRFVHLADLQNPSLPHIYFDSECDASVLWNYRPE